MGLFSRKKRTAAPARKARPARQTIFVRVRFRDFDQPVPDNHLPGSYIYSWPFATPPLRGTRVIVPGWEGLAPAVVVGMGAEHEAGGVEIKPVKRIATKAEIDRAVAKAEKAEQREAANQLAWVRMALHAANVPGVGRVRSVVPAGFPEIAPVNGEVSDRATANAYGSMWWRAYKRANELGLPDEQVKALHKIASRWYAIRDKLQ